MTVWHQKADPIERPSRGISAPKLDEQQIDRLGVESGPRHAADRQAGFLQFFLVVAILQGFASIFVCLAAISHWCRAKPLRVSSTSKA
jgi:hypothetical protein